MPIHMTVLAVVPQSQSGYRIAKSEISQEETRDTRIPAGL